MPNHIPEISEDPEGPETEEERLERLAAEFYDWMIGKGEKGDRSFAAICRDENLTTGQRQIACNVRRYQADDGRNEIGGKGARKAPITRLRHFGYVGLWLALSQNPV